MQLSKTVAELLASLVTFSNNKLNNRNDLGVLIELATLHNQRSVLNELSFVAKFASKTFGIMQRIGRDGEGYNRLSLEFTENIGKIRILLESLVTKASHTTRQHFSATYLNMTPESLQHLLALCYDLSWYKNWLIDHPEHLRD